MDSRNPLVVIFSHAYVGTTMMTAGLWFFALLGYFGLTSWLAVILNQHGFSISKSVGFVTLITIGGIPGFYAAGLLLEKIGRKATTALFLIASAACAFLYGHSTGMTELFISGFVVMVVQNVRHVVLPLCLYARALSDTRPLDGRGRCLGLRPSWRDHRSDRRRRGHSGNRPDRRVFARRQQLCACCLARLDFWN